MVERMCNKVHVLYNTVYTVGNERTKNFAHVVKTRNLIFF